MNPSLPPQGVTRLLLTRIPFFKEIIVSSFSCPSCSWSNTEIQAAGRIQEQGVRYTLAVSSRQDMNREVVKTDCASARIPELDFEVPAFSQKGVLTTIEGIIDRAVAGLEQDQPARRATDPEVARKIDEFIGKLRQLKEVSSPFTFILDDPSGNSFVENPRAPHRDEALQVTHYRRSPQQCALLGLQVPAAAPAPYLPLQVEKNPFSLGDSSTASRTGKLQEFIGKLQDIIEGKAQAHFIMDDPAGNSYLQNVYAPEEDPELSVQRYERTFEQNEELGLNDMRTEGYEAEPASGR
nr:zinc finger protein ZPR1 [Zonotrichia albicollis]